MAGSRDWAEGDLKNTTLSTLPFPSTLGQDSAQAGQLSRDSRGWSARASCLWGLYLLQGWEPEPCALPHWDGSRSRGQVLWAVRQEWGHLLPSGPLLTPRIAATQAGLPFYLPNSQVGEFPSFQESS